MGVINKEEGDMEGFSCTRFEFQPSTGTGRFDEITIESRDGFDGRVWCIKRYGNCLGKDGEWEYEMQPSSRDNEFKRRTRWATAEEATLFLLDWWHSRTPEERA